MNLGKENEQLEFKESTSEINEALIDICAILNKHQKGILYFGVKDNGEIKGFDIGKETIRDIERKIEEKIKPSIYPIIEDNKDFRYIKLTFEGHSIPYSCDGRYYKRVGDVSRELIPSELIYMILNNSYKDYELMNSNQTLDDVDEESLLECYNAIIATKRTPYFTFNKKELLNKLNLLTEDNYLNNAGKFLLSKKSNLELKLGIFKDDKKMDLVSIKKIKGNILTLIKQAEMFLINNLNYESEFNSFKRNDELEIPLIALREAIINSFAHCNYLSMSKNEINIYNSTVSIYSPGSFIDDLLPSDYIENNLSSRFRNPTIANVLFLMGYIESWASGLKKIDKSCKDKDIKYEFQNSFDGFLVIFYRKNRPDLINNENLSENEKAVLNIIKNNQNIKLDEISLELNKTDRTIKRIIESLKEKDLIERVGSKKTGVWKIK